MGKRSDFKRRKNDAYDTPLKGILPLLPHLPKGSTFIEPCAGNGFLVDTLVAEGHECIGKFDIEPRREDILELDALEAGPHMLHADYIITNPPWTRQLLHPMIEKFSDISPTWFLFDAAWIYTKQAAPYIPRIQKIVPTARLKWIPDSKHSATDDSCWYLFTNEKTNELEFVPRQ